MRPRPVVVLRRRVCRQVAHLGGGVVAVAVAVQRPRVEAADGARLELTRGAHRLDRAGRRVPANQATDAQHEADRPAQARRLLQHSEYDITVTFQRAGSVTGNDPHVT